jgi:hypothetical protein
MENPGIDPQKNTQLMTKEPTQSVEEQWPVS